MTAPMPISRNFADSQEAQYRRFVRKCITSHRSGLRKNERDMLLAIVNLWFHHRNSPKGHIHPGREKIAKRANVSVRTVATFLKVLRGAGVIVVVGRPNGEGKKPTCYTVNIDCLLEFCGVEFPETVAGELAEVACNFAPYFAHQKRQNGVQKLHTVNTNVRTCPSHDGNNVIPFPVVRS